MEPSISIACVVATLNSAPTLHGTLSSLRSQGRVDVQLLVADSGSTDGTLEICRSWGVPVLFVPPGNMYRAINDGLAKCEAEWLTYINSDDWIYPDSLARMIGLGNQVPASVVYGNCDFSDRAGRFRYSLRAAPPQHLTSLFRLGIMGFAQPAAVFRSTLYAELAGFDDTYALTADADFYLRALRTGAKFAQLPGPPVACFRIHGRQLSHMYAGAMRAEMQRMLDSFPGPGPGDYYAAARWRTLNIPHYLLRVLRASLVAGHLRVSRSMDLDEPTQT